MGIFLQLTINALIAAALYSLVGMGFSLIYSTNRFVHFAHGSVVAVGAYIFYAAVYFYHLPLLLAGAATVLVVGLIGGILYLGIYSPLMRRKASSVILLVASLALLVLINNLLLLVFGAGVKTFDVGVWREGLEIAGAVVTRLQLVIMGVAVGLGLVMYGALKYTRWGAVIRAVADNPELAAVSGIPVGRVRLAGFVVGSMLAAVAGILAGLEQNVEPYMGVSLIIKGYTGAVIGGVTSIPGAALGSVLVGAAENYGIWYLPSGYKDAIAFALLLIFLIVRPQGILGINKGVRE